MTPNATPNNPNLLEGQVNLQYVLNSAAYVNGDLVIEYQLLSDGTPLDINNLPDDLAGPGRFPGFLLAWAEPQFPIEEPIDFNNLGNPAAQPTSISLEDVL